MTTPPPFTPHRVQLVGHRSLGIVQARRVGCWLELDHPEHGGTYGPSAVFRVEPVVPAVGTVPTWIGVDYAKGPDGMAWTVVDKDGKPHTMSYTPPPVEPPKPIGTWGGHEDWIPWSGGECPVPAGAVVDVLFRCEADGSEPWRSDPCPAETWQWRHDARSYDIIAYRIATPAPKPEPAPAPAGVVLRGWAHTGNFGWSLRDVDGIEQAQIDRGGWICLSDGRVPFGPETGLRGKEEAVKRLLAAGATWAGDLGADSIKDHDTRAIRRFRPGDIAVMVDGTRRTVEATFGAHLLFTDGTWLHHDAARTAIAARIPAAKT